MSFATDIDARRIRRINLPLPIRVEHCVTKETAMNEVTRLIDVSAFGAGFNLQHPIKRGRLVHMTIPLSRQLRNYDYDEPQYRVWGLVRHCVPVKERTSEKYAIGTAFIGKHPPQSYVDNPSRLYEITHREESHFWHIVEAPNNPDESHLPKADRRHTRYPIPVTINLELLNDLGKPITKETTVTENISLGGASVFSSLQVNIGQFIRLSSEQYNVTITAIIRNKRLGKDGIPRLHLEFFDKYFPLEGID